MGFVSIHCFQAVGKELGYINICILLQLCSFRFPPAVLHLSHSKQKHPYVNPPFFLCHNDNRQRKFMQQEKKREKKTWQNENILHLNVNEDTSQWMESKWSVQFISPTFMEIVLFKYLYFMHWEISEILCVWILLIPTAVQCYRSAPS